MVKELKSVSWDKYMGTDIDSVTLFFEEQSKDSFVEEFDVPEEEKHLVFFSKRKDEKFLNWAMVVNPASVANNETATLPDITIKIGKEIYSLQEVVKRLVAER